MFPRYLLTDFRQTFVTGASRDRDELIRFWGQKVKVQGHTIAAEAHSTRRYRRVQLFLVQMNVPYVRCCQQTAGGAEQNCGATGRGQRESQPQDLQAGKAASVAE